MFSEYQLILVALIWIAILFGTALWVERRPGLLARREELATASARLLGSGV